MSKSSLYQGYNTLFAAKAFAILDEHTKGAASADSTKTFEEELAGLKNEPLFYEEEFASRDSNKRRQVLNYNLDGMKPIRKNRSNLEG